MERKIWQDQPATDLHLKTCLHRRFFMQFLSHFSIQFLLHLNCIFQSHVQCINQVQFQRGLTPISAQYPAISSIVGMFSKRCRVIKLNKILDEDILYYSLIMISSLFSVMCSFQYCLLLCLNS